MSDGRPLEERVRQTLARQAEMVQSLPPSWPPHKELVAAFPSDSYRWSRPGRWTLVAATGVVISLLATLGGLALLGARNRSTANIRSAPALPSASTAGSTAPAAHVEVTSMAQVETGPLLIDHYTTDVDFSAKRARAVSDGHPPDQYEAVQIDGTSYARNPAGTFQIAQWEQAGVTNYSIGPRRGGTPGSWVTLPFPIPTSLVSYLDPEPRLRQLGAAQSVQNIGTDTIDGETTTHYAFDCPCPEVSSMPNTRPLAGRHELWVDSRGFLRQEVVTEGDSPVVVRSIRYSRLGSPVDIRPPSPDEVQPWQAIVITATVVPGPYGPQVSIPPQPPEEPQSGGAKGSAGVFTGTLGGGPQSSTDSAPPRTK